MTETITKPSFEEVVAITTMNLPDVSLRFNAQSVGPGTFRELREADYGPGFRMPKMPELIPLVYSSLENQDYKTAKNVVNTLKEYWLTGNTGILYVPEGMFVQDVPELKKGRISMDQKALEARLGSYEESGVVFSDDRSVRFTLYGFVREEQSSLALSENPGVIALVGGEENAEKIAKASEHYRLDPYFWSLGNVKSPAISVAGLGSSVFGGRLGVGAGSEEYLDRRYSFGVLDDDAEGIIAEK